MEIKITQLTDTDLMLKAASFTTGHNCTLSNTRAYASEHSIIRTQLFAVEMIGVPTFVSVHFTRHKIGVEHFVKSNRDDRGGDLAADRNTPINHLMILNAQALINMGHMRLCGKAHPATREVMNAIKSGLAEFNPTLAQFLVPKCIYRAGICGEPKSCNFNKQPLFDKLLSKYKQNTLINGE